MNKVGFGFLRLPMLNDCVDIEKTSALVDQAIAMGCSYFDTAYTYLDGKSEDAVKQCVVERHDRSQYRIADKLPVCLLKEYADCRRYFEIQRKRCAVDYFDVYLLHGIDGENYEIAEKTKAFDFLQELKQEGLVKKIGFSFHDTPALLERMLTEHPEVDYVQLQINYLDWDSTTIQSRRCYEIARSYGKTVIVMEPVKGGTLAKLPEEACALLEKGASPASYAIRFAQSLEDVEIVLSGMNEPEQVADNLRDMPPISELERDTLRTAAKILNSRIAVACTGCGYCLSGCPKKIPIPRYFAIYNEYSRNPKDVWKIQPAYWELARQSSAAGDCIQCHRCQRICPQKLPIADTLTMIAKAFAL